jgi:hypothetical protein
LNFDKQLEFLEVKRNIMYMSEISASQTVAFSDVVSNAKEYDDFRADASTVTLYDTEA